ncbi:MAG: hypothetical protein IH987_10835 [Planctomycetes bacterium]|nr:hypothetical protein [Planctomycetota bacterium]
MIFWPLLVLVVLAPLPFAAVDAWAWTVMASGVALLLMAWAAAVLTGRARIEVAVTLAFDAPHFEPMDLTRLSDLAPEAWERVVFVPNPSVQLLSLSYPANAYLQAAYDDKDPGIPGRKSTYLAVYRKEHRVWRADLTKPMFQVLSALCDGKPFATALAAAPAGGDNVTRWFASWSADGLFADAVV